MLAAFLSESTGAEEALEGFLQRWTFALLGAGVVLLAFLINRFAPRKRRRIRRVVILYGLYLVALGLRLALHAAHQESLAIRAQQGSDLLQYFVLINLLGLGVFDLALPAISIEVVSITSDLIVGLSYIVATMMVLHNAGMQLSSVIATSALIGGVLTLSLQATLGNILGGVALQMDGSVHVGDWIQLADGTQGRVREIRWRHTVVETRNWDTVIVPNSNLLAQNILILGKRQGQPPQHRMWVYFNVDFRYPPTQVIAAVDDALQSAPIENVALDPKPHAICFDFAKDGRDSFGYYAVRYWLTDLAKDDPTSSIIRARIYAALKRMDIPLARPSRTVFYAPEDEPAQREQRMHDRRLHALQGLSLFKVLNPNELDDLVSHLRYAPFTRGETVTHAGAVAHWLYILTTGTVDVVAITKEGPKKVVATIHAPGFFGEMGLMTGEPRLADVIAMTDVECYRLDKQGFAHIIQARPEIAEAMAQMLATRRAELDTVREGLDDEARRAREASEHTRILGRIQEFFGLDARSIPPRSTRV